MLIYQLYNHDIYIYITIIIHRWSFVLVLVVIWKSVLILRCFNHNKNILDLLKGPPKKKILINTIDSPVMVDFPLGIKNHLKQTQDM